MTKIKDIKQLFNKEHFMVNFYTLQEETLLVQKKRKLLEYACPIIPSDSNIKLYQRPKTKSKYFCFKLWVWALQPREENWQMFDSTEGFGAKIQINIWKQYWSQTIWYQWLTLHANRGINKDNITKSNCLFPIVCVG